MVDPNKTAALRQLLPFQMGAAYSPDTPVQLTTQMSASEAAGVRTVADIQGVPHVACLPMREIDAQRLASLNEQQFKVVRLLAEGFRFKEIPLLTGLNKHIVRSANDQAHNKLKADVDEDVARFIPLPKAPLEQLEPEVDPETDVLIPSGLTPRQARVCDLLRQGYNRNAMSASLARARSIVASEIDVIYLQLGADTKTMPKNFSKDIGLVRILGAFEILTPPKRATIKSSLPLTFTPPPPVKAPAEPLRRRERPPIKKSLEAVAVEALLGITVMTENGDLTPEGEAAMALYPSQQFRNMMADQTTRDDARRIIAERVADKKAEDESL